jgi:hypothetical protein
MALPFILWVQQIGCVIGGTLQWYAVFFMPAAFLIGILCCVLWWKRRERADFPSARIHRQERS